MPIDNFDEVKKSFQDKFRTAASDNRAEASSAMAELAKSIEIPIRKVLLSGDIIQGIYTPEDFSNASARIEFPVDLLTPGQEREFYAYTMPDHGMIPQRRVESDYVMVPTFRIASSIDATLRYVRDSNWPVIARMLEILEAGFVKKMNDDGWQTILTAAYDRNIIINDADAATGQFTPRLIVLLKSLMRRNAGGNSATLNRGRLTDIYLSPEAKDDIRSWGLDLVAAAARDNIYYSSDNGTEVMKVFDVNLNDLDELGVGQEYQNYYSTTLGGSMDNSDNELVVGLDRQRKDCFVMPVREQLKIFEDNTLHRQGLFGLYGWAEHGFAVLDSRRVVLGSI